MTAPASFKSEHNGMQQEFAQRVGGVKQDESVHCSRQDWLLVVGWRLDSRFSYKLFGVIFWVQVSKLCFERMKSVSSAEACSSGGWKVQGPSCLVGCLLRVYSCFTNGLSPVFSPSDGCDGTLEFKSVLLPLFLFSWKIREWEGRCLRFRRPELWSLLSQSRQMSCVFFLSGYWKLGSFIWALLLKYLQILLLGNQGNTYKYYYFGDKDWICK